MILPDGRGRHVATDPHSPVLVRLVLEAWDRRGCTVEDHAEHLVRASVVGYAAGVVTAVLVAVAALVGL